MGKEKRIIKDKDIYIGYMFYEGVKNERALKSYVKTYLELPNCKAFQCWEQGDNILANDRNGFIIKEDFNLTREEWNNIPITFSDALGISKEIEFDTDEL